VVVVDVVVVEVVVEVVVVEVVVVVGATGMSGAQAARVTAAAAATT
jgi:hypothetical protein